MSTSKNLTEQLGFRGRQEHGKFPLKHEAVVSPSGEEQHHKQCLAPMAEKATQCGHSGFGCLSDLKE